MTCIIRWLKIVDSGAFFRIAGMSFNTKKADLWTSRNIRKAILWMGIFLCIRSPHLSVASGTQRGACWSTLYLPSPFGRLRSIQHSRLCPSCRLNEDSESKPFISEDNWSVYPRFPLAHFLLISFFEKLIPRSLVQKSSNATRRRGTAASRTPRRMCPPLRRRSGRSKTTLCHQIGLWSGIQKTGVCQLFLPQEKVSYFSENVLLDLTWPQSCSSQNSTRPEPILAHSSFASWNVISASL